MNKSPGCKRHFFFSDGDGEVALFIGFFFCSYHDCELKKIDVVVTWHGAGFMDDVVQPKASP